MNETVSTDATTGVVWQNPPKRERKPRGEMSGSRKRFVALLKQNPSLWARYPRPMKRSAIYAAINNNRRTFPNTEWQWSPNADDPTKADLFGRWVG